MKIEKDVPQPANKYSEAFKRYVDLQNETSQILQAFAGHSQECEMALRECRTHLVRIPEAQELVTRIDELLSDPYKK